MIPAYDKVYLDHARNKLAVMLDLAVNEQQMKLEDFYGKFLNSAISLRFARGDISVIAGMSGTELFCDVMGIEPDGGWLLPIHKSPEYWTGWALAYYQWYTSLTFQKIEQEVSIDRIVALYNPYHEMDIQQFVDKMNELRQKERLYPYLKVFRMQMGLTQQELADLTEIPVKTIRQYEQRQKNINNARGEYLVRLANALCCEPVDLLE